MDAIYEIEEGSVTDAVVALPPSKLLQPLRISGSWRRRKSPSTPASWDEIRSLPSHSRDVASAWPRYPTVILRVLGTHVEAIRISRSRS